MLIYADSWPQAMALQALPTNTGNATKQLALLVDDIWHAAGDTATDYSWYRHAVISLIIDFVYREWTSWW